MPRNVCLLVRRGEYFKLIPPRGEQIAADLLFVAPYMAQEFAAACGWIMKRG